MVYNNIKWMSLIMSVERDALNRDRSIEDQQRDVQKYLDRCTLPATTLNAIDVWLGTLSKDDFQTVCTGKYKALSKVLQSAPEHTGELIDEIFTDVC